MFACIQGERQKETTSFAHFEERDVIYQKLFISWLLYLLLWCSISPNTQNIIEFNNFQVYHSLLLWRASFPVFFFCSQSDKSGCTASLFTCDGSLFSNPLSMCWIGRMYLLFDPGWWMGCRPVSRVIFVLTHLSAELNVPTVTCFPRLWLTFRTWPANPVATLILV